MSINLSIIFHRRFNMGNEYTLGTYKYKSNLGNNETETLPDQLKINHISPCGVLLELITGNIEILDSHGIFLYNQDKDFSILPADSINNAHSLSQLSQMLNTDLSDEVCRNIFDKFMIRERRNNFVYERILNEFTQYFIVNEVSPCEGFVHLYRALEFMSYSFPLIYASKSRDYRGTYDKLKKFFSGEKTGELRFFGRFLNELFKNDIAYRFEFEVYIDCDNIYDLKEEFNEIINTDIFIFEENTLKFEFRYIREIFIEIRNRYFHMLLGHGNNNFFNINYNKNDLFQSLTPVFMNWLAIIFVKIIQHGLESSDS